MIYLPLRHCPDDFWGILRPPSGVIRRLHSTIIAKRCANVQRRRVFNGRGKPLVMTAGSRLIQF